MAESISESNAIAEIVESTDWRARAWFLERRYPDRWNAKTNSEDSNAIGLIELLRNRLASHAKNGALQAQSEPQPKTNIIESVEQND